jgi:hypothetical protein
MTFDHISNTRFARTQPREWRDVPFSDEHAIKKTVLRGIGWTLFICAIFALSLWSISESESSRAQTHIYYSGQTK